MSAGPFNIDGFDVLIFAETESQRQVALRAITRPAMHRLPLLAQATLNGGDRTDRTSIGLHTGQLQLNPIIPVPTVIPKQICWPAIGADQDIEVAIAIKVGISGAARHNRPLKFRPCRLT